MRSLEAVGQDGTDIASGMARVGQTGIRVKDILDLLAAGESRETILADFPYLEPDDIVAALEYAAAQADHAVLRIA